MSFSFEIQGSNVIIRDFSFSNQVLTKYLNDLEPEDREGFLREALEFGLNTLVTVSSQAEIREIESAVKNAKTALVETKGDVLEGLRVAFENQVDPNSSSSLISVFRERVSSYLKSDLNPTNPTSPLFQIREDLEKIIILLEGGKVQKQVESRTPIKGTDFELQVNSLIAEVGGVHGDSVEFVGADGAGTAQSGDTLVTFNGAYSSNKGSFKAIWESKTQATFKSSKGVLKHTPVSAELDKSISVRDAQCAVFVADSIGLANQPEWQELQNNKLMIVLDRENPDPRVVRMAYLWTKTIAARDKIPTDSVDVGRLEGIVTDLKARMAKFSDLKRSHSSIESGLKNSRAWVDREEEALNKLVEALSNELNQNDSEEE